MGRADYYLIISIVISLLWGMLVMFFGAYIRFGMAGIIAKYVEDVPTMVKLEGTVNKAGQNICPILTEPPEDLDLGEWASLLGSLVIINGFLIITLSGIGFMAGIRQSHPLLMLMVVFIIVTSSLQYFLLSIASDEGMMFHDKAKDQLLALLENEYEIEGEDNVFAITLNAIMLRAECCGILGPKDFKNLTFEDESDHSKMYYFSVSVACCSRQVFNTYGADAYPLLRECAMRGYVGGTHINIDGCYHVVFEYMYENYGKLITISVIVLFSWEILQLILALTLLLTPRPPEVMYEKKPSFIKEAVIEEEPAPRKFVPYWAVSSFISGDVNRIKSTEIW